MPSDLLVLIDGHYYAYRFFHGTPPSSAPDGRPTNVIRAFADLFTALRRDPEVTHWALVTDHPSPSFRHHAYPDYKAHRPPMPEALRDQLPRVSVLARSMAVPQVTAPGYEADDALATLARTGAAAGMRVRICTRDKDIDQVLSHAIETWDPLRGQHRGPAELQSERGIRPDQVVDYLCLLGDSADNVPGVRGIGHKTARNLLERHGRLEDIINHLDDHGPRRREALTAFRDVAPLTRRLITLIDVPGLPGLDALAKARSTPPAAEATLTEFGIAPARHRVRPEQQPPPCRRLDVVELASWLAEVSDDRRPLVISADLEDDTLVLVPVSGSEARRLAPASVADAGFRTWLFDPRRSKWIDRSGREYLRRHGLRAAGISQRLDLIDWLIEGGSSSRRSRPFHLVPLAIEDGLRKLPSVAGEDIYREIELPLAGVLERWQERGCPVDRERLAESRAHLGDYLQQLQAELPPTTSAEDRGWWRRVLESDRGTRCHAGARLDDVVLESLAREHEVVRLLQQSRILTRLLDRDLARVEAAITDDRLHPHYRPAADRHGLPVAVGPELDALLRAGRHASGILAALSAATHASVRVSLPFASLRAIAQHGGDDRLSADLDQADPELAIAARLLNRDSDLITGRDRRIAGVLVEALCDGLGDAVLARHLGCDRAEASALRETWAMAYPDAAAGLADAYRRAERDHQARTVFGRIRVIGPETPNAVRRRICARHLSHGSAADARKRLLLATAPIVEDSPDLGVLILDGSLSCSCPEARLDTLIHGFETAIRSQELKAWNPSIIRSLASERSAFVGSSSRTTLIH